MSVEMKYTLEQFREFAKLPENQDNVFELINGEIIEVSPNQTFYSGIGITLAVAVSTFCTSHEITCYISGADGAYDINGNVIVPDFAYKTTPLSEDYPDPVPPLWAVEVISPTDKAVDIRIKRQIYLDAGILYWEAYFKSERVDVYAPGQEMRTVDIDGVLNGGDVLPGFSLSIRELFSL